LIIISIIFYEVPGPGAKKNFTGRLMGFKDVKVIIED